LFRDILYKGAQLAYELIPNCAENTWKDMSVLAVDGSKYNLPATAEIRAEFDPDSGLQSTGRGHFPQSLTSTLYDVFRRIPVARTVMPHDANERNEAMELLPDAPLNSLVMFDRGYPSYELIVYLQEQFNGHFSIRCPACNTFPAVVQFVQSEMPESVIWIEPSQKYSKSLDLQTRKTLKPLKVRAIRMTDPEGKDSVLLTSLLDTHAYSHSEIIDLYFRRWEIEVYYRDEKVTMEVEKFHGKTSNSVRQELFAAAIVSLISRTVAAVAETVHGVNTGECQKKNAHVVMASRAAVLVPYNPETALIVFEEILRDMARVKYYRPKAKRKTQPRVNKSKFNKWKHGKTRKSIGP